MTILAATRWNRQIVVVDHGNDTRSSKDTLIAVRNVELARRREKVPDYKVR